MNLGFAGEALALLGQVLKRARTLLDEAMRGAVAADHEPAVAQRGAGPHRRLVSGAHELVDL